MNKRSFKYAWVSLLSIFFLDYLRQKSCGIDPPVSSSKWWAVVCIVCAVFQALQRKSFRSVTTVSHRNGAGA